ncbi:nicotinate-nucleotide adenylyltransferase [Pseudolactococcus insecticola]|uniref:Probable nicotinate-nucleotide adenylyltransferase n=1 Tax=Pseudolactococcus insecticola TaxID=2709158 RepID=A0A6A0B6J6_9LACT|nr:nicotinate-nucleotide adenylyltransferase [Lactococcus insecticola]GFH40970.1 putative nicotinate-nucleotide adenylyltransferase [Lactococcus insecticola]
MTTGKRIGILGGNFNPVHHAHLFIADQVQQLLQLDEVQLMPENLPPHVDAKPTISPEHRIAMLKLAIRNYPNLTLNLSEIARGGKSYTYDTMLAETTKHPENTYFFIIGGDMVDYLDKWYRISDLIELVTFVAVKRENTGAVVPKYPVKLLDLPQLNISSSDIRARIASKTAPRPNFLLPAEVLDYIDENKIYHA